MADVLDKIQKEINNCEDSDSTVKLRKYCDEDEKIKFKEANVKDIVSLNGKGYGKFRNGMTPTQILEENYRFVSVELGLDEPMTFESASTSSRSEKYKPVLFR